MKVQEIYRRVRWCYDEEAVNAALLEATDGDNELMNNIIRDKIGDALRWICLYAPAEQLSGGGTTASGDDSSIDIVKDDSGTLGADGRIDLGKDFIRLIRVRCDGWHRAVTGESLIKEDSDEYLQLYDEYGAAATKDRPQAALIEKAEKQVEVWPHEESDKYELTKLVMPSTAELGNLSDNSNVNVPGLMETSFVYYLAFLTLSAYEDSRAARMLEIAKMSLGQSEDKQRS